MAHNEIVEIRGHLIDTASLSKVLNDIDEYGGDYVVEQFDIGHGSDDPSYARIDVSAEDEETLQRILMRLQIHGVNQVDPGEAQVDLAETRRRLPRRLLLQHQPRDAGAAGRPLGAGAQPRDGLRAGRRRRGRRAGGPHAADVRRPGRDADRLRRLRDQGDGADLHQGGGLASASWTPTSRARSPRPCSCARSPTACARPRRPARRCSGWAAPASSTPVPRRPWSRWSRRGTSTCSSPATRWPPTTSSRRSTAPRWASTSPADRASSTATSTTSARSTRSARPGRSAPLSSRAC